MSLRYRARAAQTLWFDGLDPLFQRIRSALFPLGPLVRLAPNHVSVADPDTLQIIYAHGNGSLKSDFYDAFVSITRGLFNTRDRAQHTRKRKIVSHIFSPKSVLEFEPIARSYVAQLVKQWDRLCDSAVKGGSGNEGEGGWYGLDGRLWFDCLPCTYPRTSILSSLTDTVAGYNYLAFDIIGTHISRIFFLILTNPLPLR